jgi:TonB family protein
METFAFYMLKSVTWISGFALVYFLFLRNERFFALNRFFLMAGILTALIFPLITVRYVVELPSLGNDMAGGAVAGGLQQTGISGTSVAYLLLMCLYLTGALFVILRHAVQIRSVIGAAKKAEVISTYPVKLVRSAECVTPYSFFSFVVVNPSITDTETREIMNHEMVHIRQKHWVDLLLSGVLCIVQWFNPVIWIYSRFMRQNHEYLADQTALQHSSDPALYRAALLNQIIGSPVVDLGNSFNYSLNKKRFTMMKNISTSPYRKLKLFLVLPVFAIVLYSFAEPQYRIASDQNTRALPGDNFTAAAKAVKGIVVQEDGKPLEGAAVIIKGTTVGTVTDSQGKFNLADVPEEAVIVISYIGFETKAVKASFNSEMKVIMKPGTVVTEAVMIAPPPPPPPPPPASGIKVKSHSDGPPPLVVLDGVITNAEANSIPSELISSINVLKDESAIAKYGEKGKNGVIEITTKEKAAKDSAAKPVAAEKTEVKQEGETFMVVEEMPEFPGGPDAMKAWIVGQIVYPAEAAKKNISGKVVINFVVTAGGKVKDVKVIRSVDPLLDKEAVRVAEMMPDWKPGRQMGKAVNVSYTVPIDFTLQGLKVLKMPE